jgi:transposase
LRQAEKPKQIHVISRARRKESWSGNENRLGFGVVVGKRPINPDDQDIDGNIHPKPSERKTLLDYYRKPTDPALWPRAHILLLLDEARPWSQIEAMLFTSYGMIRRWRNRFQGERLEGVLESWRGRPAVFLYWWAALVVRWGTEKTPYDFGFPLSRWSCAMVVLLPCEQRQLSVGAETARRWLRREQWTWRRPRPVPGPNDPAHAYKLGKIRHLPGTLPEDETAVFQYEEEIHAKPIACVRRTCTRKSPAITAANRSTNWPNSRSTGLDTKPLSTLRLSFIPKALPLEAFSHLCVFFATS